MSKIKFLITLASAIKNGAVKTIQQAMAFAKREFGEIDKKFVDDIVNVFKKEGKTKKGDVVPIKKKAIDPEEGIMATDEATKIVKKRTEDIAKGDVEEVVDLETSIKKLKEAAEALKESTVKPGNLMDELVKGQKVMRELHNEGQVRTAVRWFMRQEIDAGRLKPINKFDEELLKVYGSVKESDPIDMFRRYYGEDALDQIHDISDVFDQGESFNHYVELLRKNVDPSVLTLKKIGMGQYDESVVAGEKLRKAQEQEAKQKKILDEFDIDPDREPNAYGGIAGQLHLNRTGYGLGSGPRAFKLAKEIRQSKKYKDFIEMLFIKASNMIRQGKGMFKNLDESQRIKQHDNLTKEVTNFQKTGELPEGAHQYFGMNPEVAYAEAMQKVSAGPGKSINISDDAVAADFTSFIKKSDPEGYKKLEQAVELSNAKRIKGRKDNADGGLIDILKL